ncbi:MAG: ClpX C4-type zinc finger protein, partial [Acidimicrobiales bacterium]
MAPLDELLLAEAREAQAAQAHAQAQADLARARFADAVRRLHRGGASMREIAKAFGLSHQRVHQLIDSKAWPCSFCGALQPDRATFIAGPGVRICNQCVALATGVVSGDARARRRWAALAPEPCEGRRKWRGDDDCSFCGKAPAQVDG